VHRHIEQGRTGLDRDDVASVRALLSRVGDPAAIVAKAGAPPPGSRRWDAWAPWLIIFGPAASGLGWVAGVLILWTSPTWSRRDQHLMRTRRQQHFSRRLPRFPVSGVAA